MASSGRGAEARQGSREGPGPEGGCARRRPPAGSQPGGERWRPGGERRRPGERRTAGSTPAQGWLGDAQVAWLRRGALEVGAPRCQPENQASDPAAHARRLGLCSCPRARCRGAERSRDTRRPLSVARASRASARALARWSPCPGARWSVRRTLTSHCHWSLLCRLWGPTLVAFLFSPSKF